VCGCASMISVVCGCPYIWHSTLKLYNIVSFERVILIELRYITAKLSKPNLFTNP